MLSGCLPNMGYYALWDCSPKPKTLRLQPRNLIRPFGLPRDPSAAPASSEKEVKKADRIQGAVSMVLLMTEILHYLKDPKLWELWSIPSYGYKNPA